MYISRFVNQSIFATSVPLSPLSPLPLARERSGAGAGAGADASSPVSAGASSSLTRSALTAAIITVFASGLIASADDAAAKRKRAKSSNQSVVARKPANPLLIVISLNRQRVSVFDGTRMISRSRVSTGKSGHRTPRGIFSILQKNRHHFSNLYDDAPMPFMQRLTWSGIALHQGRVPRYPASHGCIRLPGGFASRLFRMTSYGTRVIVARNPVAPRDFEHPDLFKPLPPLNSLVHTAALQPDSSSPPGTLSSTPPETLSRTLLRSGSAAQPPLTQDSNLITGSIASKSDSSTNRARPNGSFWLSRAQLKIKRDTQLGVLRQAIEDRRQAIVAAKELIAAKREGLKAAGEDVALVKREIRQLKLSHARAKRQAKRAARALKAFEKRYGNKSFDAVADAEEIASASAREDELETRYFETIEDAEAAQREVKAMAQKLPDYRRQIGVARTALRDAKAAAKSAFRASLAAKNALKQARRADKRRNKPIAIFISRKKGRLYVRQGYKPIYETPVTFTNPEQPVGTHVFTALQFSDDKKDLNWSVISFDASVRAPRSSKRKKRNISLQRIRPDEALQRVEIPDAARYLIAQLIKPGSSLIISDKGTNNETGKHTDFIVSLN